MNILEGINRILRILVENIHKRRKAVLALSCLVVFVTTYVLILPAFTLEKDKAVDQGGIDLPISEVSTEVGDEDLDDSDQEDEVTTEDLDSAQTDSADVAKAAEDEDVDTTGSSESDEVADNEVSDPLRYENDNYNIAVVDKDSVLPANTEIKVEEIDKEEKRNF